MTIPIPPYVPSFKPVPQVTPFTYRDGVTMLKKLDDMVKYLNRVIVPFVNTDLTNLGNEVEADINNMIDEVNAAIDSVINSSVQVQDTVVAGIFNNESSATRAVTDALYAAKAVVDSLEELVTTGRLSSTALDARYGLKADVDALELLVNSGRLSVESLDATYVKKQPAVLNAADYPNIKAAIAALPAAGGTIYVPIGAFYAGDWTQYQPMTKDNVKIIGEKLPQLSNNADRLQNGSVIYGRFNIFANNFEVDNIGFDFGKYICDTYYGGAIQNAMNHPLTGEWDAFAFAEIDNVTPTGPKAGLKIGTVIGLLRSPDSYGHAMLIEGAVGAQVYNATGIGGIHAVAFKSYKSSAVTLNGYSASGNHVIIKSDTYAKCGIVQIDNIKCDNVPPNVVPWWAIKDSTSALNFDPETDFNGSVQIGKAVCRGANNGLTIDTSDTSKTLTDVHISSLIIDGYGSSMGYGINKLKGRVQRFAISSMIINNVVQGIKWDTTNSDDDPLQNISFNNVKMAVVSSRYIELLNLAKITIDNIDASGANFAYKLGDNTRLYIGKSKSIVNTRVFEDNPPTFGTGMSNFGSGNEAFGVTLDGYGVTYSGLISAGAGNNGTIAFIPKYLRPDASRRFPGYLNSGGRNFALIGVSADGLLTINDTTPVTAGGYISVDGVHHRL